MALIPEFMHAAYAEAVRTLNAQGAIIVAAAGNSAGLAVGTEGFIGPLRRVDLFHALLTPAYPLLAWLLLTLRAAAREEIPVKTL